MFNHQVETNSDTTAKQIMRAKEMKTLIILTPLSLRYRLGKIKFAKAMILAMSWAEFKLYVDFAGADKRIRGEKS